MTVKLPWTDRRIDTSGIRAPELPEFRLPNMDIRRVDLPRVDLPRVDLPNVDLPKVDLSHVDLADVDLGDIGRAVSGQLFAIAETLSDALSDTGERAREAVTVMAANLPADLPLVSRFLPKPRSSMRPRIIAVAAASAVAATIAGAYLFFVGASGARRRAALRRRLQGTPAAAQRGIGAAVESARQVSDRAVELVRVPIETARDRVGNRTDESELTDGTPSEVLAVNAIDVAELEAEAAELAEAAVGAESQNA